MARKEIGHFIFGKSDADEVVRVPSGDQVHGLDAAHQLFHVGRLHCVFEAVEEVAVIHAARRGGRLANLLCPDQLAVLEGKGHFYALGHHGCGFLYQVQVHQIEGRAVRKAHQLHPELGRNVSHLERFIVRRDMRHALRAVVGADVLGLQDQRCACKKTEQKEFFHAI